MCRDERCGTRTALAAYGFYGGPPVTPDISARGTLAQLRADLDREGTARALVIPNYGIPDVAVTSTAGSSRGARSVPRPMPNPDIPP